MKNFREAVLEGIPKTLPKQKNRSINISHAPNRKHILNNEEKKLAIRNALRYFPKHMHKDLAKEFLAELNEYGRIYMYRFMPEYDLKARNINDIRQLKGLSLAVGPKGSGVRRISEKVLKFYGIDETNTKFIEIQILEAEKALINRRIDAAFFLLPARTPVVKNLAARPTLKLLNISESEALSHFIDPLEHVIVPKGAFKISPLIPHKNLDAIALPISIIISDNAGMGLGALVAAILKDKYPRQTFYNIDEDLPKFSYQGIKRLSAAEEIYKIGLPYLTEVFGLKFGLVLVYAFKPIVYIFVSTVLFIGVMNTYFNLVPIWSGITALFNSKRP